MRVEIRRKVVMKKLRTMVHLTSDAACALLNSGSISAVVGAVAAIYAQSLQVGLVVGLAALVIAGAIFAYSIWRDYKPRFKSLQLEYLSQNQP